jgi:uncharacterized protein YegP (UPF0339 family)
MSKTKNKPGIHLLRTKSIYGDLNGQYYWHIVSKNGRIIARSSETYTRKSGAVKSIKTTLFIFGQVSQGMYFDHSKKDSELKSYL